MPYQAINTICNQSDAKLSAAEAHGIATGMLCINAHAMSENWLFELFRNSIPLNENDKQMLVWLFEETGKLLASDQFEFDLFLPNDNTQLSDQVAALISWCRGFLYGVGTLYSGADLTGESREILKDITEFTKLDLEAEGDEDEAAFIEITEYLRSAVLLLREEQHANNPRVVH